MPKVIAKNSQSLCVRVLSLPVRFFVQVVMARKASEKTPMLASAFLRSIFHWIRVDWHIVLCSTGVLLAITGRHH